MAQQQQPGKPDDKQQQQQDPGPGAQPKPEEQSTERDRDLVGRETPEDERDAHRGVRTGNY